MYNVIITQIHNSGKTLIARETAKTVSQEDIKKLESHYGDPNIFPSVWDAVVTNVFYVEN